MMRFKKTEEYAIVGFSREDMLTLWDTGITGTRDGFYGFSGSKITVQRPRERFESSLLRDALACVTLDAGQDILALTNPDDQSVNGFVHHVPRDILIESSMKCEEMPHVLPFGGLLFVVEPKDFSCDSIWARVTDSVTNHSEVDATKKRWPLEPIFQEQFSHRGN